MPLTFWFITFINGLELGLLYALVALGFSLIYGTGRILFLAYGEVYMLGAIGSYLLIGKAGLPFLLGLALIMLGSGLLGLLYEKFLFRRFYGNDLVIFILSLGVAMLIANLCLYFFGGEIKAVKTPFSGSLDLLGVSLPLDKIVVSCISLFMILFLSWFLNNVKAGQALRAVAQDPEAASLQGINKTRFIQMVFFVGLALAGGAGVLVSPIYYVDVFLGMPALLNTLIVVIIGGIGSVPGAIAGGLFLGLLQSFSGIFLGGLTTLLSFVMVIIFLVVKPKGFFGRE